MYIEPFWGGAICGFLVAVAMFFGIAIYFACKDQRK